MFYGFRQILGIALYTFAALLTVSASAVQAQTTDAFAPGSLCTALGPTTRPDALSPTAIAQFAATPANWACDGRSWPISGSRSTLVRIDMADGVPPADAVLTTRLTRYDRLWITAIGSDGHTARIEVASDELHFSSTRWEMRMPLPQLGGPIRAYLIEVRGPRHPGMLSDITIGKPPAPSRAALHELILAALCGLMCMPLVLNFAFYRVLRQKFVLWHAMAVFSMLVQTIVTSGLINRIASLSIMQLCLLSAISMAMTVVAAAQFFMDLLEPGILTQRQKMLLNALGPWAAFWTVYYLFADGPLLSSLGTLFYAAYIPVIAILLGSMILAAARGSRTVWFQIIGWSPLMATSLVRIFSMLGMTNSPMGFMVEQHLSIAFEVIVTSLGAAHRFMAIKNQRDQAIAQSKVLENLAERDPLTGLYNRRGFEERYARLARQGYDTMAILDLDHFKRVNDTKGHATGDAVLRAVALALMPDEDTIAVRMGGEEFVLLMRGDDAPERAEHRRTSITTRIASEVPTLDHPVTASMGLVTTVSPLRFAALYAQCDKLLYDAKAAGRNCVRIARDAEPSSTEPQLPFASVVNLR